MRYGYIRTIAASSLFVILTALKLLFPAFATDVREDLADFLSTDYDYKEAISTLGSQISELRFLAPETPDAGGKAEAEDSGASSSLDFLMPRYSLSFSDISVPAMNVEPSAAIEESAPPSPAAESTPLPSAEPSAAPAAEPSASPAAETPSDYGDLALPANVSLVQPVLPFAYGEPIENTVPSGFGYRLHPLDGVVKFHYGTDIPAYSGVEIHAFADGLIGLTGEEKGYGNYVVIDHGNGYNTLYAHCSKILVNMGDLVSLGDTIALVGATGEATGPHLHFELRDNGIFLNPEYYLLGS
jgi:murein DD-endopeptidase MepM/ murein hydrolase activator NlpD